MVQDSAMSLKILGLFFNAPTLQESFCLPQIMQKDPGIALSVVICPGPQDCRGMSGGQARTDLYFVLRLQAYDYVPPVAVRCFTRAPL